MKKKKNMKEIQENDSLSPDLMERNYSQHGDIEMIPPMNMMDMYSSLKKSHEEEGIDLHLEDFGVYVQGKESLKRFVIQPLTAYIEKSSLFAILGASGSGKTTLLNILADRYDRKVFHKSGIIRFSQSLYRIGYVTQNDYLISYLTVREAFYFHARLQSCRFGGSADYYQSIDAIISDLGLKPCCNSFIGSDGSTESNRGISGGERRRVSVGLQLLLNPQVLFADEPTSGLDSFTALTVIESLRQITSKHISRPTVICSIHQPRADIFNLFDSVLLLSSKGNAIYCGPVNKMISYFGAIGYDCPTMANPADYFVDISSIDREKPVQQERARLTELINSFQRTNVKQEEINLDLNSMDEVHRPTLPFSVNYLRQFIILLERSVLINRRDRPYLYGALLESTCVGMLMAWIFWQLDDSSVGIKSKQGLLYVALSIENFNTMSLLMDRFINEVGFFDREIQEDLYHPAIYLYARTISMIPQFIVQSFIFGSILYFGCNLRLDPKNYFLFITIFFCMMIFVNGICWFCISISRIRSKAEFWSQLQHFFFSITCGFFINFDSIPIYVRWIQQINPIAYAFRILNIDEFHHRDLGQYDGDSVLSSAGINPNAYGKCWWIMLSIIAVYYFLAGIRLTWIRFPPDRSVGSFQINSKDVEEKGEVAAISSEQTIPSHPHRYSRMSSGGSNNSHEDGKGEEEIPVMLDEENMLEEFSYTKEKKKNLTIETNLPSPMKSAPSFTHSQEIHISIKNLDLSVRLPSNETKEILRDISITASPGSLIALMGGSGSGKTSLLNIIANRIPQSIFRKGTTTSNHNQISITSSSSGYFGKGEILFNGSIPTSKEIKDSIGYVPQFDTLLPGLTVQETLYFHGKLRLPMNVSEWDVGQCVQNVLRNLNLKGCAHVSVGNEYQKGISGGEKRRLSIGIQLLSDPVICLFDEPTTGLDAFAARNVIQILKELCCMEPEAFSSPNRNSLNSLRSFSRIFKRKTMILSIHQPRYDIFQEIDEVILLSRGSLIWSGSTQEMIQHFHDLGYPCPSFVNPADFILDLTSIDTRNIDIEQSCLSRVSSFQTSFYSKNSDRLNESFREIHEKYDYSSPNGRSFISECNSPDPLLKTHHSSGRIKLDYHRSDMNMKEQGGVDEEEEEEENGLESIRKPFSYSFPILFQRSLLHLSRQPEMIISRFKFMTFAAIIFTIIWSPIGSNQASIQNRIGLLHQFNAIGQSTGMTIGTDSIRREKLIFYREYLDGLYSAYTFISIYFMISIPIMLLSSFIFTVFMTFAIGLGDTVVFYFSASFIVLFFVIFGECVGIICSSIFTHVGFAWTIVSISTSFFNMITGYLSPSMPKIFLSLRYLSPFYWGSYILANNVFGSQTFSCSSNELCLYRTGNEVLKAYHFKDGAQESMSFHYGMFFVVILLYLAVTAFLFHWAAKKQRDGGGGKTVKSLFDGSRFQSICGCRSREEKKEDPAGTILTPHWSGKEIEL